MSICTNNLRTKTTPTTNAKHLRRISKSRKQRRRDKYTEEDTIKGGNINNINLLIKTQNIKKKPHYANIFTSYTK